MSYSIGVDIGGTNIDIGVVDTGSAKILAKARVKTNAPRPAKEITEQIAGEIKGLVAGLGLSFSDIEKIGVGTPGVVKNNAVSLALNLGWENEPLGDMITELTGLATYVANDANAAAYSEAVGGVGIGAESVVAIALGTGVGGGIVIDGKIWEGCNGFAAEIGHMIVEKDGRKCVCGNRGCLETYCSATALIADTVAAMKENEKSVMWELVGGDIKAVNGRTAFDAARLGDETAKGVVGRIIDYLAVGVANVINIFQPEVVCISGGISCEGDNLLIPLNERLEKLALSVNNEKTKVTIASFKNESGIIGAAYLGPQSIKADAEARARDKIAGILNHFVNGAVLVSFEPYGNGHINDTYKIVMRREGKEELYLLQRMNKNVFRQPWYLMENMMGVTDFIRTKIAKSGGDVNREVMSVYRTREGSLWYYDEDDEYWRLVTFIEDSMSYDRVEKPEQFYMSAVAFGKFQRLLADYPAYMLRETIPNFHNTPVRFENLMKAKQRDAAGRVKNVLPELAFAEERKEFTEIFEREREAGRLPLKVTHNDTKLNNILFDINTKEPICVVDLDTIMPGYSINDFGDSIRFGASTAPEDETELDKVEMSLELFELFVKGFLEGTDGALTEAELSLMPAAAKMMTFECGMRFLTDYLDGDVYFKTKYPEHNLDRARNQFKLVRDMEAKMSEMERIVKKYVKK